MTDTAPRFTRLDHDERRAQIVAAARTLFSERRYSAVSMQDIADTAGVTRGLLSYYFGSKHDLYLEVAREMLRVPALPLAAGQGAAQDQWERSVDEWLDLIDADRETWSRDQVRALLVGVMPLIANELLPQILAAGERSSSGPS